MPVFANNFSAEPTDWYAFEPPVVKESSDGQHALQPGAFYWVLKPFCHRPMLCQYRDVNGDKFFEQYTDEGNGERVHVKSCVLFQPAEVSEEP